MSPPTPPGEHPARDRDAFGNARIACEGTAASASTAEAVWGHVLGTTLGEDGADEARRITRAVRALRIEEGTLVATLARAHEPVAGTLALGPLDDAFARAWHTFGHHASSRRWGGHQALARIEHDARGRARLSAMRPGVRPLAPIRTSAQIRLTGDTSDDRARASAVWGFTLGYASATLSPAWAQTLYRASTCIAIESGTLGLYLDERCDPFETWLESALVERMLSMAWRTMACDPDEAHWAGDLAVQLYDRTEAGEGGATHTWEPRRGAQASEPAMACAARHHATEQAKELIDEALAQHGVAIAGRAAHTAGEAAAEACLARYREATGHNFPVHLGATATLALQALPEPWRTQTREAIADAQAHATARARERVMQARADQERRTSGARLQ